MHTELLVIVLALADISTNGYSTHCFASLSQRAHCERALSQLHVLTMSKYTDTGGVRSGCHQLHHHYISKIVSEFTLILYQR